MDDERLDLAITFLNSRDESHDLLRSPGSAERADEPATDIRALLRSEIIARHARRHRGGREGRARGQARGEGSDAWRSPGMGEGARRARVDIGGTLAPVAGVRKRRDRGGGQEKWGRRRLDPGDDPIGVEKKPHRGREEVVG